MCSSSPINDTFLETLVFFCYLYSKAMVCSKRKSCNTKSARKLWFLLPLPLKPNFSSISDKTRL